MEDYESSLAWLYAQSSSQINLGLERPKRLIAHFCQPKMPFVIQVAGTNGKGSVCAFIDSIAQSSGLKVGLFSSPHLIDFRERLQINRQPISKAALSRLIKKLKTRTKTGENKPSFFEISLALGIRYFQESCVDLIILETGMGGRFDATTVIPSKLSVLATIANDHSEHLGENLVSIAKEKTGIFRPQTPICSAHQSPEVETLIIQQAQHLNCPLILLTDKSLIPENLQLKGVHQRENAQLALTAFQTTKLPFSLHKAQQALSQTTWLGRFQQISPTKNHPNTFILDGAHNPHAIQALVKTWQSEFGTQKTTVIFGACQSKEIDLMLKNLATIAHDFYLVAIQDERSTSTKELIKYLPSSQYFSFKTFQNLPLSLTHLPPSCTPILITGSLFLVGESLEILQT